MNPFFNMGWNVFDSTLTCWCDCGNGIIWFFELCDLGELSGGLPLTADFGDARFLDLVSFDVEIGFEKVTFALMMFEFLKWVVKLFILGLSCEFKLIMDGSF